MPIVVLGLSHHSCPVTVREKFAFPDSAIPAALEKIRQAGIAEEGVILSTCNRVELYLATSQNPATALAQAKKYLLEHHRYEEPISDEIYLLEEPASIHHLFRVASGLDSMVLGETEILGQLKKAYELALQLRLTGPRLNKTFQKAFNVAKQIRTETHIQRGSISVGSVAVELAEKIFETLEDRHVMIIGAGDTSEKTAKALLSRGAKSIIVSNRSFDKAQALAAELGGQAIHFEEWHTIFSKVDIIISSTSAPHYVVDRQKLEPMLKLRKNRPLLLIDIAVPRDIDPEINLLGNVFLYNIDDLQTIAGNYMKQRQEEVSRCQSIIQEKAAGLLAGLSGHRSTVSQTLAFE
ncbi:MAG: Glutamyl-tRNA reductase [Verrucomicrobiales bacterium]|nr:Glutamyl-tRNA reductase [Verrucomicrobiales bacterium]